MTEIQSRIEGSNKGRLNEKDGFDIILLVKAEAVVGVGK